MGISDVYEDTIATKARTLSSRDPIYGLGRQIHPKIQATRPKRGVKEKEFEETTLKFFQFMICKTDFVVTLW
jgi:hypothetical protein